MVYPAYEFIEENKADRYVWDYFGSDYLKEKIYSLHKIIVGDSKLDVVAMFPNKGLLVITNRDYKAEEIKGIAGSNMIKMVNRPVEYSPFIKSVQDRENLIKRTDNLGIDQRIITAVCCYPFISKEEFIKTGLCKVSPKELTILKEDFSNMDVFERKLNDIFEFIYKAQKIENDIWFSKKSIFDVGNILVEDFELIMQEQNDDSIEEKVIDLHANSDKELNYGICSFLMKNGITSGKIYSTSKKILDSLGEYMTSVKIPWSYVFDDVESLGYCFVDGVVSPDEQGKNVAIIFNGKTSISVRQGRRKRYNIEIHNKNAIYDKLDEIDFEAPIHLKNEQIRQMFLKSFKVVENEIDIISPWMNFGVVDSDFVELMRSTLERGVIIKIIYGLKPSATEYNLSRSNRSDQVAKYLKDEFKDYEKQLFIQRDNIHYKLVLCDEKFKLEGGYNYLSFVGDYENEDTRKEGSPYGTDINEIRYLRKEYFDGVN